ncbi:MAG TPA: hypothetical protein VGV37_25995 [Aliidongia sp.]|uniref:hypothetical protein n=1 Tax=Aliidongia sp. TaxID=1914230 RepID=UPI002DDD69DE|nr:hypothetical protein [Aliidongia sp.]HEV2678010.1 hypothetical protein [Aliidongia sp.]
MTDSKARRILFRKIESDLLNADQSLINGEIDGRHAAQTALVNLLGNLDGLGIKSTALIALLDALIDLDQGTVTPILEPTTFANRHPERSMVGQIKGAALFTVELLQRQGSSEEDALRQVASVLESAGYPFKARKADQPAWKIVRNWKDRLSKLPHDAPEKDGMRRFSLEAARRL